MKNRFGFKVSELTIDARQNLSSLMAFLNAAGIKIGSLKTKEDFLSSIEKTYRVKIDRRFDDSTAINVASISVSELSKSMRKKLQKEARNAPRKAEASRIMLKLEKQNDEFYSQKQKIVTPDKADKEAFYKSWEWRTLRMEALKQHGIRCMCCGATPDGLDMAGNPVKIVVDHIKPLHHYWNLRLKKDNLQILCDECNQGKGAWDETDHRKPTAPDEWVIEDDGIPAMLRDQLKYHH